MSTYEASVISLSPTRLEGTDNLSIQKIGGYSVTINHNDWSGETLACYIPPDTIVDSSRDPFKFLSKDGRKVRVKAKKIRGVYSVGCLVPVPEGVKEGDNLWDHFQLTHYEDEPEFVNLSSSAVPGPKVWSGLSKYDIENGRKAAYANCFTQDEPYVAHEKLNGENFSCCYIEDKFWVKSRKEWKLEIPACNFWKGLYNSEEIQNFCKENPGYLVCGELYGHVSGWTYDAKDKKPLVRVFDIRKPDYTFMDYWELCIEAKKYNLPMVPLVADGLFDYQFLLNFVDTFPSKLGAKYPEGLVFRPICNREAKFGRVILKLISNKYLSS